MKPVTLTINGKLVRATQGEYLLGVLRRERIDIPALCNHEAVEPYGGCRLCMIEVTRPEWDGWKNYVTSCLYPAADGLVIQTDSPQVIEIRRTILDLYLARCPEAKLVQDLAARYGVRGLAFEKPMATTLADAREVIDAVNREFDSAFLRAPGEEGQVDFFRGAPTFRAEAGEWQRPWVFRMTLAHSRHGYEEAAWDPAAIRGRLCGATPRPGTRRMRPPWLAASRASPARAEARLPRFRLRQRRNPVQTPRQVIASLFQRTPAERVGLRDSPWGDTLTKWVGQGYPTTAEGKPVNPAEHFAFDMVGVGGFEWRARLEPDVIVEKTEAWRIVRDGNGATFKWWNGKSGTPEHVDFAMSSRRVWEADYKPHVVGSARRRATPSPAHRRRSDRRPLRAAPTARLKQAHRPVTSTLPGGTTGAVGPTRGSARRRVDAGALRLPPPAARPSRIAANRRLRLCHLTVR